MSAWLDRLYWVMVHILLACIYLALASLSVAALVGLMRHLWAAI